MGLDPEAMGGRRNIAEPVSIWPDMADAFALFCSMATQWRWTGAGFGAFRTGLDYGAITDTAQSIGIKLTEKGHVPAGVFSDVRALEAEALAVYARKRK